MFVFMSYLKPLKLLDYGKVYTRLGMFFAISRGGGGSTPEET